MAYTKEDLELILENKFLLNRKAFSPGRTNDDVVDSYLICYCLDREWTELFAKWVDNFEEADSDGDLYISHDKGMFYGTRMAPHKDYEIKRILEHYERIKSWWEHYYANDKRREECDKGNYGVVLGFAINY